MTGPYKDKEKEKERRRYRELKLTNVDPCRCTFCGAVVEPDDRFCTECGNSREGIVCPKCGTLNHRSFCSNCNAPLNELALEAIAEARRDPHFIRAEELAKEMAELEALILQSDKPTVNSAEEQTLTEADRETLASYSALFSGIADIPVPKKEERPAAPQTEKKMLLAGDALAEAVAAYREKAAELQQHLDAMLPPSAATPEEQRNFFSARKISTYTLQSVRQGWVCNYCGYTHRQPSECAEPQLGGRWIMEQVRTETTSIIYE